MRTYIVILIVFLVGWYANSIYGNLFFYEEKPKGYGNIDGISPGDHIKENNVEVYGDKVVLNLPDKTKKYSWSRYASTGSMKPTLKEGHNGIEILDPDKEDIKVGDIISYRNGKEIIVHRVIDMDYDEKGWYAVTKGDANKEADPFLVREDQVEALTVAVIY